MIKRVVEVIVNNIYTVNVNIASTPEVDAWERKLFTAVKL